MREIYVLNSALSRLSSADQHQRNIVFLATSRSGMFILDLRIFSSQIPDPKFPLLGTT
jgi:hypothetical protein